MNPIEQFEISPLKELGRIGAYHSIFTNSAAYMFLCVAILVGVTLFAMRGNSLVPGRLQSALEAVYEFIADTVRQSA
ncbi:MAG: F0F1 ATP synthase subunit A, partial [Hyphomicrobiales bacterium]|nr:F0F1 ATP synthase subunit A [Hyphomicrobiales bacterium]